LKRFKQAYEKTLDKKYSQKTFALLFPPIGKFSEFFATKRQIPSLKPACSSTFLTYSASKRRFR
jgi:hypothetical protein